MLSWGLFNYSLCGWKLLHSQTEGHWNQAGLLWRWFTLDLAGNFEILDLNSNYLISPYLHQRELTFHYIPSGISALKPVQYLQSSRSQRLYLLEYICKLSDNLSSQTGLNPAQPLSDYNVRGEEEEGEKEAGKLQ